MTDILRIRLTAEQTKQLSPLVTEAARDGQNVLFVAVTSPCWSQEEGAVIWEFEVCKIRAKCGQRVKKAILAAAS
jgi:hypothetical protein